MKTMIDVAIRRVRAYRDHKEWGRYRLANEAGLATNTCMFMDNEDWDPRATTLRKLEAIIPDSFSFDGETEHRKSRDAAA